MNKGTVALLAGGVAAGALVLGSVGAALAGTAPGSAAYGGMLSGYGSAGMLSGYGSAGMMGIVGPGSMMGNGGMWSTNYRGSMMSGWSSGTLHGKTLTLDQAQQSVLRYIAQYGNPNLAIDKVTEFQRSCARQQSDQCSPRKGPNGPVRRRTGSLH